MKNNSVGYYYYNKKYNSISKVGEVDITFLRGTDAGKNKTIIFENHIEYFRFLEINKGNRLAENVILLNGNENKKRLIYFIKQQLEENKDIEIINLTNSNIFI